jgi:hypothetical protein
MINGTVIVKIYKRTVNPGGLGICHFYLLHHTYLALAFQHFYLGLYRGYFRPHRIHRHPPLHGVTFIAKSLSVYPGFVWKEPFLAKRYQTAA